MYMQTTLPSIDDGVGWEINANAHVRLLFRQLSSVYYGALVAKRCITMANSRYIPEEQSSITRALYRCGFT